MAAAVRLIGTSGRIVDLLGHTTALAVNYAASSRLFGLDPPAEILASEPAQHPVRPRCTVYAVRLDSGDRGSLRAAEPALTCGRHCLNYVAPAG